MKKFFAILLVCALIFSTVPTAIFAEGEHVEEDITPETQCECPDKVLDQAEYQYHVEPNCVSVEYDVYLCGECGDFYTNVTGPNAPENHVGGELELVPEKAPTCTEAGHSAYWRCRPVTINGEEVSCGVEIGKVEYDATGHNYDTVVVDPTCTEGGYTTHVCLNCDDRYVDGQVPAHGHNYQAFDILPTCTEEGYTKHVCFICNDTYSDATVAALGHNWVEVGRDDFDCYNDVTIFYECSNCHGTKTETEAAPMQHDYEVTEIPATCTSPVMLLHTCKICGATISIPKEGSVALGHSFGNWEASILPDCTTEGENVRECSVCHTIETEVVPALGHTEETIPSVPADCVNSGLTAGVKCSVCDVILEAQEVVPAHGHNEEIIPAVAPDCSNTGLTAGVKCSICDEILVPQVEIPANPEMHVTVITKQKIEPTCCSVGYTRELSCVKCGHVVAYPQEIPVDPDRHDLETVVTDPTCTEQGYTTDTCKYGCGYTATRDFVDALGHTYGEEVTDPNCTEQGYTTHTCSVCNHSYRDTFVPALGHNLEYVDAKAPECLAHGWYAYEYCTVCDHTTYTEIPATGHSHGQTAGIVYPTCTNGGYTIYICLVCNETFIDNETDALGHTEGAAVVENYVAPGCVDTGSYDNVVYCSVCDAELSRETEVVDALGHTPVDDAAVAPDCVNTGLTAGTHCSVCGEVLEAQEEVPALGHTPVDDVAVAPDCVNTGLTAGTHCSVCNEVLEAQDVIPALGHTEVVDAFVAPTFDTTGLTEGKHCSVCNEILVAQTEIPTLSEMITFSYEVTGINGAATATNSGLITLKVYITVDELYADVVNQARFWGVDLKIDFTDDVKLIAAEGNMFSVFLHTQFADANAANSVIITSTGSVSESANVTFTGAYEFATLTFKVANDCYKKDVAFNVTSCDVYRNEEANNLTVNDSIDVDNPEASIYVAILGDANLDGKITGADSLVMSNWYTSDDNLANADAYDTVYDMDKDGDVDPDDFLLLGKAVVGDNEYLG